MNALTPVRHVSGVDVPQASQTVYVRAEHLSVLAGALANAFDLSGLRQLAVTGLSVTLDNIVPVEGRTVVQVAFDLTTYATDSAPGGIKHLLEGALALNPRNPDLLGLAAHWQDLVFVRSAPCPYPGMAPFSERQSDMYFGRTKEIQEAVQQLRLHPFLAIIGASGSGKSSLVFAGIVPEMHKISFFGRDSLAVRVLRPGAAPMVALAAALNPDEADSEKSALYLAGILEAGPCLLVVDQFEEVFSVASGKEAEKFLAALLAFTNINNLYLIITVRADFYPNLINGPLWQLIKAHRLEIGTLTNIELREAIKRPAEQVGVTIDDALVERLAAETGSEPGALPFLQETLVLLWEKMTGRRLSLEAYTMLGHATSGQSGLQAAMAMRADTVLAQVESQAPGEGTAIARRIFLRLIQFGEGRPDTRRQQTEYELQTAGGAPIVFAAVLAQLIAGRLLTAGSDMAGQSRKIDIAHEALIAGWPQLAGWIGQRRQAEQTRRRLEAKAAEWVRLGKGEGGLLDSQELKEARAYADSQDGKELGVSPELVELMALSQRAINPGWNPLGSVGLLAAVITVAALVSLAFIVVSNNVPPSAWMASICGAMVVLLLVIGTTARLLRRADRYVLQHWTQQVVGRKSVAAILAVIVALTTVLWGSWGVAQAGLVQECSAAGFDRQISEHIAVVNQGVDQGLAEAFASRFFRLSRSRFGAVLTSAATARACRSYITYSIVLREKGAGTTSASYIAEVTANTSGRREVVPVAAAAGCRAILDLSQTVLLRFGEITGTEVQWFTDPAQLPCGAVLAYEEGYQQRWRLQWASAAGNFARAIALYEPYVDAHMELANSLSQMGRGPEAVAQAHLALYYYPKKSGVLLSVLGTVCYSAEDLTCARQAFEEILAPGTLDGEEATKNAVLLTAYSGLGAVYRELGLFARAGAMLDKFEKMLSTDEQPRRNKIVLAKNRGLLAYKQGEYARAAVYLEKADGDQQLNLVDRFGGWLAAQLGVGNETDLTTKYQAWNEEIVYYLALTQLPQGNKATACSYLRRYVSIPQSHLYFEEARRHDAPVLFQYLGCRA